MTCLPEKVLPTSNKVGNPPVIMAFNLVVVLVGGSAMNLNNNAASFWNKRHIKDE